LTKKYKKLLILCAGGMGTAAAEAIRAAGNCAAFLDDYAQKGLRIAGFPVLGPILLLPELAGDFDGVCAANGDGEFRSRLLSAAFALGLPAPPVVHPSAVVSPFAALGSGCFILAGAYVGPFAAVGKGCIVNTGAIVEHHCRAGVFSHVCPGASLLGHSAARPFSVIGANASVLPRLTVGEGSIVGAGAVVTKNVEAGVTVAGAPAKKLIQEP